MSALTQALVDAGFNVRRAEAIEAAILGSTIDSENVSYDNATSGLAATDVQAAIDELQTVGTWTPVLTFATPGDLSVTYAANSQRGTYTKVGRLVIAEFNLTTATFTHTTAVGNLTITGLPFSNGLANASLRGQVQWAGITKANYTDIAIRMAAGASDLTFSASGSGQAASTIQPADVPTGGTVSLNGFIPLFTA
jgi:hypothetical protein